MMKQSRNKGQILIEAVAAVVIGALALSSIMHSLAASYRSTMVDQEHTRAMMLLEDQLQRSILLGASVPGTSKEQCSSEWPRYTCASTRAGYPLMDEANLDQLRLSVLWPLAKGDGELSLSSFLPRSKQ